MWNLFRDHPPWDCVVYSTTDHKNKTDTSELFYFRDTGNYFSFLVPFSKPHTIYYPQVSPDYGFLAYILYEEGQEDSACLCIVPTENLWKPLDWQQVREEMDGAVKFPKKD